MVRPARDAAEVREALELRRRVFCDEQGVAPEADRDGRDPEALHVVAVAHGTVLATCRVLVHGEVAKLGRLVVEAGERRRGIGRSVLAATESCARESGAVRVELDAQLPARGFYERAGYVAHGPDFVEQGIPHTSMEKAIA